jgi:hypothetical protein
MATATAGHRKTHRLQPLDFRLIPALSGLFRALRNRHTSEIFCFRKPDSHTKRTLFQLFFTRFWAMSLNKCLILSFVPLSGFGHFPGRPDILCPEYVTLTINLLGPGGQNRTSGGQILIRPDILMDILSVLRSTKSADRVNFENLHGLASHFSLGFNAIYSPAMASKSRFLSWHFDTNSSHYLRSKICTKFGANLMVKMRRILMTVIPRTEGGRQIYIFSTPCVRHGKIVTVGTTVPVSNTRLHLPSDCLKPHKLGLLECVGVCDISGVLPPMLIKE